MYFYLLAIKTIIIIIIDVLRLELLEEPNSLNNFCCFKLDETKLNINK